MISVKDKVELERPWIVHRMSSGFIHSAIVYVRFGASDIESDKQKYDIDVPESYNILHGISNMRGAVTRKLEDEADSNL